MIRAPIDPQITDAGGMVSSTPPNQFTAATPIPAGPPTLPGDPTDLGGMVSSTPTPGIPATKVPTPTDLGGMVSSKPTPEIAMEGAGQHVDPLMNGDAGGVDPTTGGGAVPDAYGQGPNLKSLGTSQLPEATDTGGMIPSKPFPQIPLGGGIDISKLPPPSDINGMTVPGNPGLKLNTAPPITDYAPGSLPAPPPTPPGQAGAIDPTNDLRSKTINTAPTARTVGAQGATDAALSKLTGTDRQTLVDQLIHQYMGQTAPDARLSGLQGQVDSAAKDLAGVDRYKMAQDQFSTYADQTDPAFQKTLRDITDREVGMGGFTGRINTSYGDAGLTRERDLRNERSTLFNKALEGSIQDAFGKESALSGLEGQLSGEDLNRFSTAAGVGTSNASADESTLESKLGAASGVESQAYGEDANQNDQTRAERDYEVGQEGESYQRGVSQHQQEQQDQMSAFEREMQRLGAGEAGNPAGEIGALSTEINPGLDMAALTQLAQGAGAASVPRPGTTASASPLAGLDWASILKVLQSNQPSTGAPG